MRATITIESSLLEDLMQFTQAKTRTAAVTQALSDWVRRQRIQQLKALRGKLHFDLEPTELRALDMAELEELDV